MKNDLLASHSVLLTFTGSLTHKNLRITLRTKHLRVDYIFTGNATSSRPSIWMNSHNSLHGQADNIIWRNCRWKETDRLL